MSGELALAEKLKDVAQDLGLCALRATVLRSSDQWTTVEVRHAGLYDEAPDGWSVEITEYKL